MEDIDYGVSIDASYLTHDYDEVDNSIQQEIEEQETDIQFE